METRGRRRILPPEHWRVYYMQKQREWRAAHPRPPNTTKTKNSGASAPCEVFSAQMNSEVLTKKSPPMNILRVSYSRGSRKSLWSAFIATLIVIIGLVLWSYTQGQRKFAMKANPNKSVPNDTELRTRLGKHQYRVTREGATETPFQNAYWDNHQPGIYVDIITGEPLFSSLDKFDSGTGWPSFTKPISKDKVVEKSDSSFGMERIEVRSSKSDSHLGHVFKDGPQPNGERYSINSAALRFIPVGKLQEEGLGDYLPLFSRAEIGDQKSASPRH
jgi:peptide-methionine (R)-S-oxide reductase